MVLNFILNDGVYNDDTIWTLSHVLLVQDNTHSSQCRQETVSIQTSQTFRPENETDTETVTPRGVVKVKVHM